MRKLVSVFASLMFIAAIFAIAPRPVSAQEQDTDPPGRVARLNYIDGSVSYQVSGDSDWVQADPNRPLTTGDNLWADQNSRGEVHIGSTSIRLWSETGISFLNLDDRTAQIQLAQGTIEVHLRNLAPGDAWEIDTPNLAFTLTRAGEYRISTDPNSNNTMITVREGEGSVTGGGESWDIDPGQQYSFSGTDQLNYDAQQAPGYDDFETWCQQRDQMENNSPSARYVSRDVDGYYDLDSHGTWSEVPDYGPVWVPNGVDADWVPYHYGHWVWIAPWGWTWVDNEPWGWAPFHYGRWVVIGARWGWVPGPVVVRPVYAPALVGFVGGGGWSVSVGFGGGFAGVAWFPLGPRDVFVPGYRCSERYVTNVNVTNTRIVNVVQVRNVYNTVIVNHVTVNNNIHYTYENNTRAITAVNRETFVNARPVQSAAVRVNDEQIHNVHVVENAPVAPTRASYVSSTARVSTARPAIPPSQRPVVARLTPAAPARVRTPQYTNDSQPFNQPNRGNEANRGNENRPVNNGANNGNGANGNNSYRPFTPPNQTNSNVRPNNNENNPNVNRNENNANSNRNENNPNVNRNENNPNVNRNENNPNANRNENNRPANENENQARSTVRFTPPVKAKDENYDVHPPLNQNQNQRQQQPPKQENKQESKPQPKPAKPQDKPHGK